MGYAYQEQHSKQTLSDALQEYYTQIPNLITEENASKEVADLFHFHDTCHVVFGCDTSLHGEFLADCWSIFGTTVSLKAYMEYAKIPETKQIFKDVGYGKVIMSSFKDIPTFFRLLARTRKMTKKWPFLKHDKYLNMPLDEIRQEFNINVIR